MISVVCGIFLVKKVKVVPCTFVGGGVPVLGLLS